MDIQFNKIEVTDLRPIREIILQELRSAIFEKKLAPGDRLVENIIAQSMGVSRTPVREALRQLEIEGLAVNIPRKGTLVKGISKEDAIEIYDIREMLEGLAMRLACLNISRLEIKNLKEALETMKNNMGKEDEIYYKAQSEFHKLILTASRNKRLKEQMDNIYEYLKSLRTISLANEERKKEALEEHIKIVEAIENGDEDLAEKIGREHIKNAKQAFIKSYGM